MEQLWQILGRSYIHTGFGLDTLREMAKDGDDPTKPEKDPAKLKDLSDHLHLHRHRPSRWELTEVNRIFFVVDKLWSDLAPFRTIADAWNPLAGTIQTRPTELWALLGLASIDKDFGDRMVVAAQESDVYLADALREPPEFFLEPEEIPALAAVLRQPPVVEAIGQIRRDIWVYDDDRATLEALHALLGEVLDGRPLRKAPCSGGHTRVKLSLDGLPYLHISAPLIDSLAAEALSDSD